MFRSVMLGAALLALVATGLNADTSRGIRFDEMPVGCRIFGTYTGGQSVVDEYLGRKGGLHRMQTREDGGAGGLIRTTFYNDAGWMVRKEWATGQWEAFAPFSCFDKVGACTYVYTNGDGDRKTFKGRVKASGDALISSGGFAGEPAFPRTRLQKGSYGLTLSFTDGNASWRVTRFENCNLSS